jgi:hypothetical protein
MFFLLNFPLLDQIGACVIIWKLVSLGFRYFSCLLLWNGLICIPKTSNIYIRNYEKWKLWTPHVALLMHLKVHSPYKRLPCYTTSHKLTTCYILFKKVMMHDVTHDIFLIIEKPVFTSKTYQRIMAISQLRSMCFYDINHFVNVESKEFPSAPPSWIYHPLMKSFLFPITKFWMACIWTFCDQMSKFGHQLE